MQRIVITKAKFVLLGTIVQLVGIATMSAIWGVFSLPFWVWIVFGMLIPFWAGPRFFLIEVPDKEE